MPTLLKYLGLVAIVTGLGACGSSGGGSASSNAINFSSSSSSSSSAAIVPIATKALLGEQLFSDANLSLSGRQACATCHNPEHGFIDNRLDANGDVSAVSLGDDGFSLGDRNTPSAAYAFLSPAFSMGSHARFNSQQPDYSGFVGGQFWDGRAADLTAQAAGPLVNPIEMGMPDEASVIARVQENAVYVASLKALYGATVFDKTETAYNAITDSLGAFEKTPALSPFDSKYDKSLRGEYRYDPLSKAAAGKALFFSQQFVNCATCHQLRPNSNKQEVFTSFEYHNIGVPVNTAARAINGKGDTFIDEGLALNPAVTAADAKAGTRGKFKVPTLRNIAVTAPYMHNGVFRNLSTVVQFYDHYLTDSIHTTNPETGKPWADPEVAQNISDTELKDGNKMSAKDVEDLVCFLRTLTDARYEALMPAIGYDCEGF
ncbi:MAG: cytochrome c peroxidase [Marinagarivorans sp.]|nr:cytochrome c peroxidase [Marinagarivorans sp.]